MIGATLAVHPGEILREEFLIPHDLTVSAPAKYCDVPRSRISRVVREETPVTAYTALRFGKVFGTGPEFWMNLQSAYDLATVDRNIIEGVRVLNVA